MSRRKKQNIKINYPVLKTGDIVVCGGRGLLAYIIRWSTTRFKNRRNKNISCHTAMVIDFHGQKLIVEMLGTDGGIIRLNSLERYLNHNSRHILDIKRFYTMDDVDRQMIEEEVARDIRKGIEYDYRGCLEFAFKNIDDKEEDYYCSEYVLKLLKGCEKFFTKAQMSLFKIKISPEDINQLGNLFPVKNWKKG